MRAATGRPFADVETAACCLLAYRGVTDPTAEQLAGAGIEANIGLELYLIRRALTKR